MSVENEEYKFDQKEIEQYGENTAKIIKLAIDEPQINGDLLAPLFGRLNSIGEYLLNLNNQAASKEARSLIWGSIKEKLEALYDQEDGNELDKKRGSIKEKLEALYDQEDGNELDKKKREKLLIILTALTLSWTKCPDYEGNEEGELYSSQLYDNDFKFENKEPSNKLEEIQRKYPDKSPNIYLNKKNHEKINEAIKLFDLRDKWFSEGEAGRQLTDEEIYALSMMAVIAVLQAYEKDRIEGQNYIEYFLYLLGKFSAGLTAKGCGFATGFAFSAIAIAFGGPFSYIAIAIFTMVLLYSIGEELDNRYTHNARKLMTLLGILITAAFLAIIILLFPPQLMFISAILIGLSTDITNWFIFRDNTPEFYLSLYRRTEPYYSQELTIVDGENADRYGKKYIKFSKMPRAKIILLFIIALIGAGSVGFGIYALFSGFMLKGFISIYIPKLLAISLSGILGAFTFLGYLFIESKYIADAAKSDGFQGAIEKMAEPAIKVFKTLPTKGQKVFAITLTLILCSVTFFGILSLGFASSISLIALIHVTPLAFCIAAIFSLFLAPFYLTTTSISVGKITKALSTFFGNLWDNPKDTIKDKCNDVYDGNFKDISENNLDDSINLYDTPEQQENIIPDLMNIADGKPKVIITKGPDAFYLYYKRDCRMQCRVISESKDKELYDLLNDHSNGENRKDIIDKTYKNKKGNFLISVLENMSNNSAIFILNATGNYAVVPTDAGEFIDKFLPLKDNDISEQSFALPQAQASLFAAIGNARSKEEKKQAGNACNRYVGTMVGAVREKFSMFSTQRSGSGDDELDSSQSNIDEELSPV